MQVTYDKLRSLLFKTRVFFYQSTKSLIIAAQPPRMIDRELSITKIRRGKLLFRLNVE